MTVGSRPDLISPMQQSNVIFSLIHPENWNYVLSSPQVFQGISSGYRGSITLSLAQMVHTPPWLADNDSFSILKTNCLN
jgi:hypothetical protein